MKAAAVLLALMVAGCVATGSQLTPEQQTQCAAGGGCVMVTREQLRGIYMQGAHAGIEAAQEQGCGRQQGGIRWGT